MNLWPPGPATGCQIERLRALCRRVGPEAERWAEREIAKGPSAAQVYAWIGKVGARVEQHTEDGS